MRKATGAGWVLAAIVLVGAASAAAVKTAPPVAASNGMVVCDQRLAAEAGVAVLKNGGNAVDAAVATAFALAVVYPSAGNIGGGGFLVYYGADGKATTFDFREKAPLAATERMFLDARGRLPRNANHEGLDSVGVPGTVAGLVLAHEKLGSRPWAELVQPAIELAEKGFPVSAALSRELKAQAARFVRYPASAKVFLKEGNVPYQPGEVLRQPDLAQTLRRIQQQGHNGFYRGRTAELIVNTMKEGGGLITAKDLAAYRAVERPPVRGLYRGYEVISMGPPSSGGIALIEMLNILEGFDLAGLGHNSPRYMHVLTEAMRRAYADRAEHLGDPDFNSKMPLQRLLSKEYAARLRASIRMDRASRSDRMRFAAAYESTQTTHLSVVDAKRNCVALTYTLEQSYGSAIVVEGAGFLLNNEMGDFNPVPGATNSQGQIGTAPNLIAPEKRMLSSMTPTVVLKDGKPVLVIGTPGGRTIINTVLQVVLNVVDHKMDIAVAIAAGRLHHQWLPDVTAIERRAVTRDSLRAYERMGHKTNLVSSQGHAMGILIEAESGRLHGAADPRSSDGAALGY
ncbi:MAG: gamma-glutamyltransferase [Candidatus Sumerlaeia bacterium]|nr:gamma-glutamyltransferase [Candidatus Sumerlaeia bacterium]